MRTYWHRVRYWGGCYRHYQKIDLQSVERLVFVCRGNICRSPYAEAIAKSLGIDSVSCGIDTRDNFPANESAVKAAEVRGINLRDHRATPIQTFDIRETDLLVAMEPVQVEYLSREYGGKCKCSLLGLWGRPVTPYIKDPYGASSEYFNHCFNYIEKSVHEITRKVSKAKQN